MPPVDTFGVFCLRESLCVLVFTPERDAGAGMPYWLMSVITPRDDLSLGVGLLRYRARAQMTLNIAVLQIVVEPY